jgi:hypothetical protein
MSRGRDISVVFVGHSDPTINSSHHLHPFGPGIVGRIGFQSIPGEQQGCGTYFNVRLGENTDLPFVSD